MLLASIIILLSLLIQPQEYDSLEEQAYKQVEYYTEHLETDGYSETHIWALARLCENTHKPDLIAYINKKTEKLDIFDVLETPFCEGSSVGERLAKLATNLGTPNLLLASLLKANNYDTQQETLSKFKAQFSLTKQDGIDYETLVSKVVERDSISTQTLPYEQFRFAHYLLLYSNYAKTNKIFTEHYYRNIANRWFEQDANFRPTSLESSLALVTLLRALFLSLQDSKIQYLHSDLKAEYLFPVSDIKANIYQFWDYSMYMLGRYDKGLEIVRDYSIPLTRFLGYKEKELNLLKSQGVYLYRIGKILEAQKIYEQVLRRANRENIDIDRSSLYTNLSITHLKSGHFDKYLDLQFKALELAESQNNYRHQYKILRNLHVYYRQNGDEETSLTYINKAKNLAQKFNEYGDLGSIFISLGVFYRDLKSNPDSATSYFKKAEKFIKPEENFNQYTKLVSEKAELQEQTSNFEDALKLYSEIEKLAIQKENTQAYLEARIDKASILLQLDRVEAAQPIISEINKSDLSPLYFLEIVEAKTLQANHLFKTNNISAAYKILNPTVVQIIDWARNSTDIQSGFWNIEQEYIDAFQLYVDLLIESNRFDEAVLTLDKLKTINDADLYQDPIVKSRQLNESELMEYKNLSSELDRLRKQQLSTPGEISVELQSRIDRLNAQKRSLDRKISSYSDQPSIQNIQEIQQRLKPQDLVLHITELENTYYVARVTRRDIDIHKVDLDESTRQLFEDSIQGLATGNTDLDKLYEIGEKLDISSLPSFAENLILIPDSYLFQLPIDIIPTTQPANNYSFGGTSYIIEQFQTEYLTSLNELVYGPDNERSFTWDYVGFGISTFEGSKSELMPLPYAPREVNQISEVLQNLDQRQTIIEKQSTESAFREMAPHARILHLATHSTVSESDPLFSTIYMSAPEDSSEDQQFSNQIFAYELFEMNLSNDLIMLNSCESGSGSYLQGSGIVGISRALRFAGAQSLVLNLWSVNDMMASEFAVQFYKSLNDGSTKSEALRKAKVHFLKQKNANPHYWGPYMLIGSNRPVVEPYRASNSLFAAGFMFYLILMVSLSYVTQKQNGFLSYPGSD